MGVKVSFELENCQSRKLVECPMFSPSAEKTTKTHKNVGLRIGCANKNACQCKMNFGPVSRKKAKLIQGMDNFVELSFNVTNQGSEPAYGSTIVLESEADFRSVQGPTGLCKNITESNVS